MINSKGQESRPRGTISFPMEYYNIDTSVPDYNLPYHWHTEFEFIHILRGEYTIFAGTKEGRLLTEILSEKKVKDLLLQ